jgi:hypothetical protein
MLLPDGALGRLLTMEQGVATQSAAGIAHSVWKMVRHERW